MTAAFDKLKAMLEAQGTLSDAEISSVEGELGVMTDEERIWISSEVHDRMNRAGEEITVEQYLAATQTLESAAPGSPEYENAKRIVDAFESAA